MNKLKNLKDTSSRYPSTSVFHVRVSALVAALTAMVLPGVSSAQDVATDTVPARSPESSMVAAPVPQGAPRGMEQIDRMDLRRHAYFLASEGLGGRHTGTRGQEMAATYIAANFEALGFEPLGDETADGRDFMQRYPVTKTWLPDGGSHITFGGETRRNGFGVLPGAKSEDLEVTAPVVYTGRPGRGDLDDFPEGAIALMVLESKNPARMVGVEQQFMLQFTRMQKIASGAQKAFAAGASAVLVGVASGAGGVSDLVNYTGLVPGKPLLSYGSDSGQMEMLGRMIRRDLPIVFLGEQTTTELRATIDATASEPVQVEVVIDVESGVETHATNVCALLRGSDPKLRDEAIVISAHMDHMGTRLDAEVFNGADDNASGSSSLLEVAQAFAAGERPQRSIIFLSVSGEELGLWGSDYYATHPTWPLSKIIANINIDMIGRNAELSGPDEISITPSYAHPKYSSIGRTSAALAEQFGLGLVIGDTYYERSDHYNFAERGVPVVFFCDGEHEDYHQVTDTPDKLNYDKIERVARLAFWTGVEIANAEGRPSEIGRQKSWAGDER